MRSRAPLVLMEQLIMVLVFALAAAVCVQAFVLSDRISQRSAERDRAMSVAQSAAETWKSCRGDGAAAARQMGGRWSEGSGSVWRQYYDADWTAADGPCGGYAVQVRETSGSEPNCAGAAVEVLDGDGDALYSLNVLWQTGGNGNA